MVWRSLDRLQQRISAEEGGEGPKLYETLRWKATDGAGATLIRFCSRQLCVTYLPDLGGICYEPPRRIRSQLLKSVTLVLCASLEQNLMQGLCQVWPFSILISVMADNTCKSTGCSGIHYVTLRKRWTSIGLLACTSMLAASQCQKRWIGCSGDALSLLSHAASCVLNIIDTCGAYLFKMHF